MADEYTPPPDGVRNTPRGNEPVAYLEKFLDMFRPHGYATEDFTWGELEKLLDIVHRVTCDYKLNEVVVSDLAAARTADQVRRVLEYRDRMMASREKYAGPQ